MLKGINVLGSIAPPYAKKQYLQDIRRRKLERDSRKWMLALRTLLEEHVEKPVARIVDDPPSIVPNKIPKGKFVDALVCFVDEIDPAIVNDVAAAAVHGRIARMLVLGQRYPTSGDWIWQVENLPVGQTRKEGSFDFPVGKQKPIRFCEMGYYDEQDMRHLVSELIKARKKQGS